MKINRISFSVRHIAVLLAAVFVLTSMFCLPVSAETESNTFTVPGTAMTVTLPEGTQILTLNTSSNDPVWAAANILDPTSKVMEMADNNIQAEIYACDGDCVISVSTRESDYSKTIFNLNQLDEEQKADFLEYMKPASMDGSTDGTIEWYAHPQIPFFCIDIHSSAVEESAVVYERLYCTLFDGMIVSFDLYNATEEIPEEYDAVMRALVDSVVISEFKEAPGGTFSAESLWILLVILLLLILIVAFVVQRLVTNKREKNRKKLLADQIVKYRQSKTGNEDEGDGKLLFVNETLHDDTAVHIFANYQAYHHNLLVPAFTIIVGIIAFILVWQSGTSDDWWMMLLLAACVVFSLYRTATAGTTITKSMNRVFSKMRSRKAVYYFYEGDFRITGLQASNLHPYFQITRMRETKEYFYMYFGEENSYFIKKDGFKEGDADAFRSFMKSKLGRKFR